jgi:hypothetical protein
MEKVRLYHATTAEGLAGIHSSAEIKPPRETGVNRWRFPGENRKQLDNVYLADKSKAENIARVLQEEFGGTMYVLEAYVDSNRLVPDEDSQEDNWKSSLEATKTCAHRGPISNWRAVTKISYDMARNDKLKEISKLIEKKSSPEEMTEIYEKLLERGSTKERIRLGDLGRLIP